MVKLDITLYEGKEKDTIMSFGMILKIKKGFKVIKSGDYAFKTEKERANYIKEEILKLS
jgi:hypothetical protein